MVASSYKKAMYINGFSMEIKDLEINDFWCRLSERVFNLGCNIFPKDVHCTLVFDENLKDLNFHLTKNTRNPQDKPQIKIVIIEKKVFNQIAENTLPFFITNFFERFDMKSYREKHQNEVGFISTVDIDNSDLGIIIKNALFENLTDISKIKANGKKLEIKGDINSRIDIFAGADGLIESIFEAAQYIKDTYGKTVDAGILLTQNETKHVLRINEEWFTFRSLNVFKLLCMYVTRKTAYQIICKTEHALELLKEAQTYSDTEKYNYPIRIVLSDIDLDKFICPKCKLCGLEHDLYC